MFMKIIFLLFFALGFTQIHFGQQEIPYGNNLETGKFIEINDVKLYYEVYGEGTPILLIHGNKTGIKGWKPQIEAFSKNYKVFAIDCRGRGNSELGNDSLSYFQMANDLSVFLQKLELDSVHILGKSDGGIVGLLMGIYFPERIHKIVAFGANISPDSTALYSEVVREIHKERIHAEKMIQLGDTTDNWQLVYQRNRMMEFQPSINPAELKRINVHVLVMSCDRDLIKLEHSLMIYNSIPNSNLSIFPGEVHGVTRQNPDLFNATALRFFELPFVDEKVRFE
jgi:pimeloyl-ACP methyl ester carboxylesterase